MRLKLWFQEMKLWYDHLLLLIWNWKSKLASCLFQQKSCKNKNFRSKCWLSLAETIKLRAQSNNSWKLFRFTNWFNDSHHPKILIFNKFLTRNAFFSCLKQKHIFWNVRFSLRNQVLKFFCWLLTPLGSSNNSKFDVRSSILRPKTQFLCFETWN